MNDPTFPAPYVNASDQVDDSSGPSYKDALISGVTDFRNVFLYPLCTGIMTGIGFVVGKRLGESYFYGSSPKTA